MSESVHTPPVRPFRLPWWWVEVAIVLIALAIRLPSLEIKPPHFDEGVNGYFVDLMRQQGYYHYDPTNFHGPLHFYLLFLMQTLFGRHIWAFRLPLVLLGAAAVGLMLAFRRFLPPATCRLAALAMALSPAYVFYSRYAIHETEMLAFLLLLTWGLLGVGRDGDFRSLCAAALGATGCILTKETYIIHFVALGLALPTLWLLEKITRTPTQPRASWRWTELQAWRLGLVCVGLILFFYSGGFLDFPSLRGLFTSVRAWVETGAITENGHSKEWHYWLFLITRFREPHSIHPMEWPVLVGLLTSLPLVFLARRRAPRYLLIVGWGTAVAYSLVPYKTPWCLISFVWPFFFAFGESLRFLPARLPRLPATVAAVLLGAAALLASAKSARNLNFRHFADEKEPYVYVQTLPDINLVLQPIYWLGAHGPEGNLFRGYILYPPGDSHPLPWLLNDFPNIVFLGEQDAQPTMDAEVLLVEDSFVSDMEERLTESYFRQPIVVRGNSGESGELYLRASTFAPYFPDRQPEFSPLPKENAPAQS